VYAAITAVRLVISTVRWFVLYEGSIRASTVLYQRLLEAVLFADIHFHDTVSRGRLLNRFGKDFEGELVVKAESWAVNSRNSRYSPCRRGQRPR
jgi:ABC transporter transmembrane region